MSWLTGVDVAKYQGNMKWAVLANDGLDFAYVRFSVGLTVDPLAKQNVERLRRLGIPFGGYHFFYPDLDIAAQTRLFTTAHQQFKPRLVPMVDVESRGKGTVKVAPRGIEMRLAKIVNGLTAAVGKPPAIYTSATFWNQWVKSIAFGHCPIILARYVHSSVAAYKEHPVPKPLAQWTKYALDHKDKRPVVPLGWSKYDGWQFSAGYNGCGKRYGAESADLDLNIMRPESFHRFQIPTLDAKSDVPK